MRIEREHPSIPEVVLDHPPVNALRSDDFLALADAVTTLGRDRETRAIILRSDVEKAFAAGVDVHEMTEGGPRAVVAVTRACAEAYGAIAECEVPVIAVVHGYCLATGVGLAGNADVIVASDDAVFGLPEVDRGGLGTATQLQSLVPPHKARWLAYSCARIPATELARYGTVERVVPRADLDESALRVARDIAAKDTRVIRAAKEALNLIDVQKVNSSYRIEQGFTFELNLAGVSDEHRDAFAGTDKGSK